jgi:hypothetical protein
LITSRQEILEDICKTYESQNPSIALALTAFVERYENELMKEIRLMKQKCYAYRHTTMPIREVVELIDIFSDYLHDRK